jgi:hypothetical protein
LEHSGWVLGVNSTVVRLAIGLPLVGAVGGGLTRVIAGAHVTLGGKPIRVIRDALAWSIAFVLGGVVSFYGYYLLPHALSDVLRAISQPAGILLGAAAAGFIGGYITGLIGARVGYD